jgi:ATP-dependent DNA helicase UvrD/PcrA
MTMSMDISEELNEEQLVAAKHLEGPLLVLAGAGSGKTRCVIYRIVNLIECGIPSSSILGVTFTNKAAEEMRKRVEGLSDHRVLIATFHSLGARILRESIHHIGFDNRFIIYDQDDSLKLVKKCIKELGLDEKAADPKATRAFISNAKNAALGPDEAHQLDHYGDTHLFINVYEAYQKKIKECNAVDFDDLLLLTVKLFQECPKVLERYQNQWQFLLVDEYQDTNATQYEIIRLLAEKSNNLFVVGDPDQSIYSWRGANISNILNFEKDYPHAKVVKLERNYRSTSTILSASNDLIIHNTNRYEKNLWSDLGEGEKIKHFTGENEFDEARFVAEKVRFYHDEMGVPLNEMVIFYRTNFQSRVFEDQLLTRSLPYVIIGGVSFYQRKEIKDILGYLKLAICPSDYVSFARTINLPKRGIGGVTAEKMVSAAAKLEMPIFTFCQKIAAKDEDIGKFKLSSKQEKAVGQYVSAIEAVVEMNEKHAPVGEIIGKLIDQIQYFDHLGNDKEQVADRKENLFELQEKANQWSDQADESSIEGFLEEMSLRGQNVEDTDIAKDTLNLMTLHNGKGLEFRVVFIAGLDNDLLPHANSRDSFEALQEERRLLYVGMTRAKERLYFCSTLQRNIWGQTRKQTESCFLKEISSEYIQPVSLMTGAYRYYREHSEDEVSYTEEAVSTGSSGNKAFKLGDAVFHKNFGVGIVQDVYEGSVGTMVDVLFYNEPKTKSLVLKYAKLKRV